MDGLEFWNIAPVCLCLRKCLSDFEFLWEDIWETETWVINVSNSGFHCIFYRELYVWLTFEMAVVIPMHDFTGMSINTHGMRRLNGSKKDCHVGWASQRNPDASIKFKNGERKLTIGVYYAEGRILSSDQRVCCYCFWHVIIFRLHVKENSLIITVVHFELSVMFPMKVISEVCTLDVTATLRPKFSSANKVGPLGLHQRNYWFCPICTC